MVEQRHTEARLWNKQNPGLSLALRRSSKSVDPSSGEFSGLQIYDWNWHIWPLKEPHPDFSFKPNESYHSGDGEVRASKTVPLYPNPLHPLFLCQSWLRWSIKTHCVWWWWWRGMAEMNATLKDLKTVGVGWWWSISELHLIYQSDHCRNQLNLGEWL